MKKKIYLMSILLLVGSAISAQMEKGNWLVSGLNLVSFQSGTDKYSSGSSESKSNFSILSIGPSIFNATIGEGSMPTLSYGFTNQLFGGITVMFASVSNKDGDIKSSTLISMIGPSARYFIMKEKKFLPFVEAKAGIGSYKSEYGDWTPDKMKLSGWYLGTGATYFFRPKTGIDFNLGYQKFTSKDKNSESDSKGTNAGLAFGIGILIGF
jgi:outer membrane protein